MSQAILVCPKCHTPAPPRVDLPIWGFVDRYTCDECGLTTLRSELKVERNLSILYGGAQRGTAGITGLIDTLRPSGDLGDQNDLTLEQSSPTTVATTEFSTQALSNLTVSPVSIDHVRFTARVRWENTDQGPLDAVWYLQWREGSGAFTTAGPLSVVGDFNYHELSSGDIALDASAVPWSVSVVNSLEMRVYVETDDQGTQNATELRVTEYAAEVHGST